jgi:hypothetical protein
VFRLIGSLWVVVSAPLFAQAPPAAVLRTLPNANALAVAVTWPHADVHGTAPARERVLAECRLAAATAAARGVLAARAHVDHEVAIVVGVVDATSPQIALAFVSALLQPAPDLADDTISLQTARVALQLDDAAFLYPGDVLRARAEVAAGLAATADAETAIAATAALTPIVVRQALAAQRPASWGAIGALPADLAERVAALAWPALADVEPAGRCSVRAPSGERGEELHARSDAPWIAAAFPAPAAEQAAVFAIAIEVARARAVRAFRHRGREADARAPAVAWSPLAGDPLVRFHRRGEHPRQLLKGERREADAAAELVATEAELVRFLNELREVPPSAIELQRYRDGLLAEFGLRLPSDRPAPAPLLPHWLLAGLLLPRRGIDANALSAVTAEAVLGLWQDLLQPGRGHWHRLLPKPRADVGWRRR